MKSLFLIVGSIVILSCGGNKTTEPEPERVEILVIGQSYFLAVDDNRSVRLGNFFMTEDGYPAFKDTIDGNVSIVKESY